MVSIFTGSGAGYQRGSGNIVGAAGLLGSGVQGRGGDNVSVNAATGNLLISRQDEFLIGRGPDLGISRTYNSLAQMSDGDNGDQWQQSTMRRVFGLTGTLNTAGSTVSRQSGDGSVIVYTWDAAKSAYITTDGDGAHEKLVKSGATWVWTDGSSQYSEVYSASHGDATIFRITEYRDSAGYKQSFAYLTDSDKLDRVTTQNHGLANLTTGVPEQSYIQYYWNDEGGIDHVLTGYTDYGDPSTEADNQNKTLTRTWYEYSGGRLSRVRTDLTPSDNIEPTDAQSYWTAYGYDSAGRVNLITQKDGSSLTITYDASGRVATLTQSAAPTADRITSFSYGLNYTNITGPDGKVTRLDYAGGNLVPQSPLDWGSSTAYVTKEPVAPVEGQVAGMFTSVSGASWSGVSTSASAVTAGDTLTFGLSLMAVAGSATSQTLGLYGSVSHWGTGGSTARIVSGPGTLVQTAGGLWQVNGLSTTEATRIEITRTYTQSENATAFFYVDLPGGYRDGEQLIAAGAVVTKNALPDGSFRQLTKVTAPPAYTGATPQTVEFEYDDDGNLTKVTDAAGKESSYTYDTMGNVLTATDANENVVTRTYGAKNEMLTETRIGVDANGNADSHTTRYVYGADNLVYYVISPENRVTEYRYSYGDLYIELGYPEQPYTGGAGNPTRAAMDAWREALTDRSSIEYRNYVRDARGNLYYTTSYGWAQQGGQPIATEGYSRTYFSYDQAGQMLSRMRVGEATETFLYDGMGRMVGSTDLAGGSTTIIFNDAATTTTITTGTGYTSVSSYNKAGDLVSEAHSGTGDEAGTTTYRTDSLGRIRMVTTPRGTETTSLYDYNSFILYDQAGRKTANIAADGSVIEYRYDAAGRLAATVAYANKLTSTQMQALADAGGVSEIGSYRPTANATADQWSWSIYDDGGRLIQSIDATGSVVAFDYDASDRLIRTTVYATKIAVSTFVTTPPATPRTVPTSADDRIARNFYDGDGLLIGALDGEGYLREFLYDTSGRKLEDIAYATRTASTEWTSGTFDALRTSAAPTSTANRRLHYVYDGEGNLRFTVDNSGHVTGFTFDAANRGTTTIAYATSITTSDYSYDAIDFLVNGDALVAGIANDAIDRESYTLYNDKSQVVFTIDAGGLVTAYSYDIGGRVTKSVQYATLRATPSLPSLATMTNWQTSQAGNAQNRVTRNWYSAGGKLLATVDAEGYRTLYEYDADGNRIAESTSPNAVSVSDATSLTTVQTLAAGTPVTTSYAYDPAGRLETVTDGEGFLTRYSWSGTGQQTSVIAAWNTTDASETRYIYDGAGRVTTETRGYGSAEASSVQYQYNAFGEVEEITDPLGKVTINAYDERGLLTSTTDALSGVTSYEYNGFGEAVKVTDPRGKSSYSYYDNMGRLIRSRDAESYVTETSYTAFGEVASVVRRYTKTASTPSTTVLPTVTANAAKDATVSYTYDKRGLVLTETDAVGQATSYSYTATGEVKTVTRATAVTSFDYDRRGLVTKTTDAEGWFESYGYDAYGNRTSVTAKSKDGTKVAGGTTTYVYDKRGLLLSETLPVAAYNADGTVQASTITNSYAYDGRGNRTQMIEAAGLTEARTTLYEYDKANRLTTTKGEARTVLDQAGHTAFTTGFVPEESIKYDAAGNVTRVTDAAGNYTVFFYDDLGRKTVEINAAGTYTRHYYDENGNVTETRVYAGLASVPLDGGGTPPEPPTSPTSDYRATTFTYDNLNRLLTSTVSGVKTGAWNGTSWASGTTDIVTTFVYDAMDNVVKTIDANGKAVWSYYDKAGRKTAQVDAANYLTSWSYDAEGNVLVETRYSVAVATPTSTETPPAVPATDNAKRITTFTYDKVGNRLSEARSGVAVHDGAGGVLAPQTVTISWQYNGLGQVIQKNEATDDPAKNRGEVGDESIYYSYDVGGRLIQEERAAFTSHQGTSVTPTVDYNYNGLGDLARTVAAGAGDAAARETRYTYGAGGLLSTVTDATGVVHEYFYDKRGTVIRDQYYRAGSAGGTGTLNAVLTKVDVLGRTIEQSVAAWSGTAWVKGDIATTEYNRFGEVARSGINGLWQTQNEYDGAGRLVKTNAGDGVWKLFGYDKAGHQTLAITSAGEDLSGLTFDAAFAKIGESDVNATYTQYDARGLATGVTEEQRQLNAGTTANIASARSYNAFGEVLTETDANGGTTTYSYNAIGRMIRSEGPAVRITLENGKEIWVKPSQDYYYDQSGRLVATRDANGSYAETGTNAATATSKAANSGNLTRLTLLAGTGYGGGEAMVTAETHADSGVKTTKYDIHGDARTLIDELGYETEQSFDAMGRVTQVNHAGGLVDSYSYDSLGQRVAHWNNLLGSSNKETADYDVQGRVTAARAFGGDVTTTSYSWDASLAAVTGVTTGGWSEVTTMPNGRTLTEKSDIFSRTIWKSDLGSHVATYAYDAAGRQTSSTMGGLTATFTYYNTGQIATNTGPAGTATYTYDVTGNRLTEKLVSGGVTVKDQSATYDALGHLLTWAEAGTAMSPASSTINSYDANGNIRRTQTSQATLNATGAAGTSTTKDYWFRFDSMNRLVTDRGVLSGTQGAAGTTIIRGRTSTQLEGRDILYDDAGQRIAVLTTVFQPGDYEVILDPWDGTPTRGDYIPGYFYETRESYGYDNAGRLSQTRLSYGGSISEGIDPSTGTGDGIPTAALPSAPTGGNLRSSLTYDLMGRLTLQQDYEANGTTVAYSRNAWYNTKGQLLEDYTSTKKGSDLFTSRTGYDYGVGAGYALGSMVAQASDNHKNGDESAYKDTATKYTFAWYDGAVQASIIYDKERSHEDDPYSYGLVQGGTLASFTNDFTTTFYYNGFGQLTSAYVGDGMPKTVTFTGDELGQIIRRDETRPYNAPSTQTGSPHEVWYRFGSRQMGYTGNNGTSDVSTAMSIAERQATPPTTPGTFRGERTWAMGYQDFALSYDPLNSYSQGNAGGGYTVQAGDTLAGIAQRLYGDANLWYKVAEANGMSANAALVEGQSLILPAGVVRNSHNASTFKPYDPAEATGDLSPTTPKPKKKPQCGMFGQILVAAIAIGITAIAPFGGGFAAQIGNAVLGSAVSQGFGVATGIQDKFNFKGVAMSAITAGLTAGIGEIADIAKAGSTLSKAATFLNGSGFTSSVVRAVAVNVASQGIGVATGLQSKFDFAGVAAAGVGAGIGHVIGRELGANSLLKDGSARNIGANMAVGAANLFANAATRSAINGNSFGDNILAALPDTLGQIIGQTLGGAALRAAIDKPTTQQRITAGQNSEDRIIQSGEQAADPNEIIVTARLGPSIYVDHSPSVTAALIEFDIQTGGLAYAAARHHERVLVDLRSRYEASMSSATPLDADASLDPVTVDGLVAQPTGAPKLAIWLPQLNSWRADARAIYENGYVENGVHKAYSETYYADLVAGYDHNESLIYQWTAEANGQVDRLFGGFVLSGVVGAGTLALGSGAIAYMELSGGGAFAANSALGGAAAANQNGTFISINGGDYTLGDYGHDFAIGTIFTAGGMAAGWAAGRISNRLAGNGFAAETKLAGSRVIYDSPIGPVRPAEIGTPWGSAFQSSAAEALAARSAVEGGAPLYRLGTVGRSEAAEAQFWALEHPLSPGYASRYGIPPENVAKFDFIESATLKPGTSFVTRPAPGIGSNPGGGIEVVVPRNGVLMKYFGGH